MEFVYRNNAGKFRIEVGMHLFGIDNQPRCATCPKIGSSESFDSTVQFRAQELLKNTYLLESCPSILQVSNQLRGDGCSNLVNSTNTSSSGIFSSTSSSVQSVVKKLHSCSAPNEGITGKDGFLSPFTNQNSCYPKGSTISRSVHLENPERETRWYFKYFLGKAHQIFCGNISEKDPMLLTIVKSEFEAEGLRQHRAILWTKFGSQKLCVSNNFSSTVSPKKILSLFDIHRLEKGLKEIWQYEAQKDTLTLEEQEGSVNFKFGVIYCKEGQTSDEEMYNNEIGSAPYQSFLQLLGDRVSLTNWDRFKGGLDSKTETTGIESVYTIYEGHEIMFHVSTLLPISKDNKQQIERKRHIGNDIVNIIFFDTDDVEKPISWKPSMMKTHFTHIFAVVTYNQRTNAYRLSVFSEESVPYFGPTIPNSQEFSDHEELRHFLLVKLINGEKAAFHSPVFAQKRIRTFEMLLNNILEKYTSENNGNGTYRRAFSETVQDSTEGTPSTKEQNRNDAFIRFGQMLKLNTIIRGDAPTSCITTGISKQIPWQPRRLDMKIYGDIISGDAWGKVLLVCAEFGVFALEEHQLPLLLIERSVEVKQLKINETAGVMIIRYDKGRESRISILPLSELPISEVIDRALIKKCALERSKGCHLFATSESATRPLRLVCAVGRRLLIYQWQVESIGFSLSSWNQFMYSDLYTRFTFIREVPTSESVQVLTILDSNQGGRICAGYRNQFDLLDERTGETLHMYRTENRKSQAVAIIEMRSDDDLELLLCFNRNCYLQRVTRQTFPTSAIFTFPPCSSFINSSAASSNSSASRADVLEHQFSDGCFVTAPKLATANRMPPTMDTAITTTTAIDFNLSWNFEPRQIVLAPPYILAFTESAIEFRLLINGSLVHTMTVPYCLLISAKNDIFFASSSKALHQSIFTSGLCQIASSTANTGQCPPDSTAPQFQSAGGMPLHLRKNCRTPVCERAHPSSKRIASSPPQSERAGEAGLESLSGIASMRSQPSSTCLMSGCGGSAIGASNISEVNGVGGCGQPTRYIYIIPIKTLTGQSSPERDCESPNPIRILSKIRELRESDLQFFPISPS